MGKLPRVFKSEKAAKLQDAIDRELLGRCTEVVLYEGPDGTLGAVAYAELSILELFNNKSILDEMCDLVQKDLRHLTHSSAIKDAVVVVGVAGIVVATGTARFNEFGWRVKLVEFPKPLNANSFSGTMLEVLTSSQGKEG